MLSHNHRFHGYGSLRYVYHRGIKIRGPRFALTYNKNPRRAHTRFAVVVSKKVFKSAVKRNRLRRRLYEIIRLQLDRISTPYDVVLTVFDASLLEIEPEVLRREILELLAKARLIS